MYKGRKCTVDQEARKRSRQGGRKPKPKLSKVVSRGKRRY